MKLHPWRRDQAPSAARIIEPSPPTPEEETFASWATGAMPAVRLAELVGDVHDPDLAGDRLLTVLGMEEVELEVPLDARTGRRWAYTKEWFFSSQDEDLVVRYFPLLTLVQLSAAADCFKGSYCAFLAEDQVRERVNDAARIGPAAISDAVRTMKEELAPLGTLDDWPATEHLRRVDAVKDLPLDDLQACINLASIVSRCCGKDPSEYQIHRRSGGFYITNIDGHFTKLAASTTDGQWAVLASWNEDVDRNWWRQRVDRGIAVEW